jgi:hypothetical protein
MLDSAILGPKELEKCKKFARIAYNLYSKALTSKNVTVQVIRINSVWCIKMLAAANAPAGLGGRTAVSATEFAHCLSAFLRL